jgi:hypothetical protein
MGWIDQAQDRNQWQTLVNIVKCLGSLKCWEIPKYLRDWGFLKKDSGSGQVRMNYVDGICECAAKECMGFLPERIAPN